MPSASFGKARLECPGLLDQQTDPMPAHPSNGQVTTVMPRMNVKENVEQVEVLHKGAMAP